MNVTELRAPQPLSVGDVVTLKTGGPAMVIMEKSDTRAHCCWHKDDGDMVRDWVPLACLKAKP